ncbi:LytR/AlgR family response regulator transcription factor [Chitinophaga pinensis]|uniref:LytR/AlgR family response regulator transcription factor n=1 Tax=Chitinophaga pinensis TaxID=79329 RepID=UPI001C991864|nr:LytTR family transcriptional regulator DNA-binding domain-containing protein [Chitinophaga pinensis]
MPKMNGIDFLKIVQKPPMVIITTAFPSYALEGFQLNVMDYLLKPITFDRFFKAANKAKDYYHLLHKPAGETSGTEKTEDYFLLNAAVSMRRSSLTILYVQGMQNYVTIYTRKGKYMTLLYLKHLEENLDRKAFIRVHNPISLLSARLKGLRGMRSLFSLIRFPSAELP